MKGRRKSRKGRQQGEVEEGAREREPRDGMTGSGGGRVRADAASGRRAEGRHDRVMVGGNSRVQGLMRRIRLSLTTLNEGTREEEDQPEHIQQGCQLSRWRP